MCTVWVGNNGIMCTVLVGNNGVMITDLVGYDGVTCTALVGNNGKMCTVLVGYDGWCHFSWIPDTSLNRRTELSLHYESQALWKGCM